MMINIYSSPKRGCVKRVKETKNESGKGEGREIKASSKGKNGKKLKKMEKGGLGSRSGNLNFSGLVTKTGKINKDSSDISLKIREKRNFSNSQKVNLTDIYLKSQESEKNLREKNVRNLEKAKNLKSIKNKLLEKISGKESISKIAIKASEEPSKSESMKTFKKEKKILKKTHSKSPKKPLKIKKPSKPIKKPKNPSITHNLTKNKQKLLQNLSDLNDRISSFKLNTFLPNSISSEKFQYSIIKIQSAIRGYLTRKIFSETLTHLKNTRLQKSAIENTKSNPDIQKQKIQFHNLMEMRQNDLQQVSSLLKTCENIDQIQNKLEEIINKRYIVLSQSIGTLPLATQSSLSNSERNPEETKEESIDFTHKLIRAAPSPKEVTTHIAQELVYLHRDSEKTPKKQVNVREARAVRKKKLSVEFLDEIIKFPLPGVAGEGVGEESEPVKTQFAEINLEFEKIKRKRVVFEIEVFVFGVVFQEALMDLCREIENNPLSETKTKVPVRHFNFFSNTVKHFITDKSSLMSYLSRVVQYNKPERVLKKVKKYWSPLQIISKCECFLDTYKNSVYFSQESLPRTDKLERIYKKFELDVINEAFSVSVNEMVPSHWVCEFDGIVDFENIVKKLSKRLEKWVEIEAGKVPEVGMVSYSGMLNEDILQTVREDNLEKLVQCDIEEEYEEWVNLKYRETGVVLSLGDGMLAQLILETVSLL